ncbi:hypothetical protein T01_10224 [Trichinella spiralis]|uniref:Uncharacterized protein n=1 Tax=Trichinella spiralis TaxID=6334 RepID=A0A0V1B6N4_TRISP|nr:hypothetical protein T01_10224 [Trichinella spiralis]
MDPPSSLALQRQLSSLLQLHLSIQAHTSRPNSALQRCLWRPSLTKGNTASSNIYGKDNNILNSN